MAWPLGAGRPRPGAPLDDAPACQNDHGAWPSPSGSQASAKTPSLATAGRQRRGERTLAALVHVRLHLRADLLDGVRVEAMLPAQPLGVELDRVATRPMLEELGRHVAHVVVRSVAVHAHRLALDQGRAGAAASPLGRLAGGLEDRFDVVAVDAHPGEAVALRAANRSSANSSEFGVE